SGQLPASPANHNLMWRICCCTMISLKSGAPSASAANPSSGLPLSCAQARPVASTRQTGTSPAISLVKMDRIAISSPASLLADRRQCFAAGLHMSILASLIERRTGFRRTQRRIYGLDPVCYRARLLIINQDCINALDAAVSHQKALGPGEESSCCLDRIIEFLGVLSIEFWVWLDGARLDGKPSVEHVELEIGAAALRKRQPIWLAGIRSRQRHYSIAFVGRNGRGRSFSFFGFAFAAMVTR